MEKSALTGLDILIVEDELLLRKQLAASLEKLSADVTIAGTLNSARKAIEHRAYDIVLLDVNLPDGVGTDLLREKAFSGKTSVVVMTADGGITGAVEAIRLGAVDYLAKPFDPGELLLVLGRARQAKLSARVEEHRRSDASRLGEIFFFGASLAIVESQLEKILAADRRMKERLPPVLIQGETGTGKTTIARWLHHQGPRHMQSLVEVNCSALPETLAESELFGHERGAFTDARTARIGLFEAANGGTLFLDELPSLSSALQAKVLTAIEDHKIRRVGGNKEIPVDVRILAATNRDLRQLVSQGQFREDLFHRLDLYRVHVPPLRDRSADVLKLAELLSQRICQRHRLPVRQITKLGEIRLLGYRWPGNVRELSHELERAIVFEETNELSFEHLLASTETASPVHPEGNEWFNERFIFPEAEFSLEEAINRLIRHALQQTGNNVSAAARLLGVSRDYVRYRFAGQQALPKIGE